MIILKTIVFIWVMSSILLSVFLFFSYCYVGMEGIGKSELLLMQLIAPYLAGYICVLSFKRVITIINKKRKLKRNGNNA